MNILFVSHLLHACCRCLPVMLLILPVTFFAACSEAEEVYPDIITEFADIHTDGSGHLCDLLTDGGACYVITNTDISPHRPDTVYRAVVGFVPEMSATSPLVGARIYSLVGACVLGDSTGIARHDPTGIESMWTAGSYVNMQLTAKSQGGVQHWGYVVDSLEMAGTAGRQYSCHYLSVHHVQGADPLSYSRTYYCSILIPSIPQYHSGDTLSVTVHTFNGQRSWTFLPL